MSGASEITFPILDGYEILGNGLFKSGVAIPYPEGYYMEDGVGIFTPVYAPVDAYVYAIECTDQLKGLYNITLYSEAEELYFEFIGIYNYYDTAVGQQHPFYPAVNKKVIAGDVIGKYRRIEDSGGIESSEWL